MNKVLRITIIAALVAIIVLSIFTLIKSSKANEYRSSLQSNRNEKDIWFGSDFDSPFLKTNTPFHRLNYFEPNIDFVVNASFTKNNSRDSLKLVTSTGKTEWFHIYGEASFTVKNIENVLQLLYHPGDKELFIPFMDATSGKSTYGAGRYLETDIPAEDKISLDFNMAYNPYCAYVEGYSCPFPPKSNVLDVAIEAGEKTFHE